MKKRHARNGKTTNMQAPTNQPKTKPQLVTWDEVSEWQRDNKFIIAAYRPESPDYLEIFKSLTFLHNETCNVYTHLIGALLLPFIATAFMWTFSDPRFVNVSAADYVVFGLFFWMAECCLVFSTGYHLMQSHSYDVEVLWHGLDLLGIVILTVATFIAGIYYVFFCEPYLQKVHWTIVSPSQQTLSLMC